MDLSKGRLGSLKLLTSALTVALGISLGSAAKVEAASASQKPKASVAHKTVKPTKKPALKPVSKPKASTRKVSPTAKAKTKATVTKPKAAAVSKVESQPLPGVSPSPEVPPKPAVSMPEPQGATPLNAKASATSDTLKTGAALLGGAALGAAAQKVMADSPKPEANTPDNDAAISEKARIEAELKSQSWGEVKAAPPGAKPTWEAPDLAAAWAEEEANDKTDEASLSSALKAQEDVTTDEGQGAERPAEVKLTESTPPAASLAAKSKDDDATKNVTAEVTPAVTPEATKSEDRVTTTLSADNRATTVTDAVTPEAQSTKAAEAPQAERSEGESTTLAASEKTPQPEKAPLPSDQKSREKGDIAPETPKDKLVEKVDGDKPSEPVKSIVSGGSATTVNDESVKGATPAPVSPFTVYEEAYPPKVLPFLGITPYVTTKADIKARFEDKAHSLKEGSLGDRDAITEAHVPLGDDEANQWLVSYTRQGTVSDLFISMPSDKREAVIATLKAQFEEESPDGFWKERSDGTWVWRDATSQCVIYPSTGDDFSIEYGAVARVARETSDWMTKDVSVQLRFAHVDLLKATLADLKTKESTTCHAPELLERNDGDDESVYVMKGQCFGLPGEEQSLIWLDENHQHLSRLSIEFSSRTKDVKALETSLQKRFVFNADLGQYKMEPVPYRNIWVPSISLDKTRASLTFHFYGDGVRHAHDEWVKHLEEKAEQHRLNEKVDALFN